MSPSLFVTGTGTNVGKTLFSALFLAKYAKDYGYRYWKPIQTCSSEGTDTDTIQRKTGLSPEFFHPSFAVWKHPSSPHFASSLESAQLDLPRLHQEFQVIQRTKNLIEGAGGIMVPLDESTLTIQFLQKRGIPCLVVASSELGTINHTLLTLEAMQARLLPVLGVYLLGRDTEIRKDNARCIEKWSGLPVLGYTPFPNLDFPPQEFVQFAVENFDSKGELISLLLSESEEE